MVDGDLFDKLAEIGTAMFKNGKPFGGIQVRFFPMKIDVGRVLMYL